LESVFFQNLKNGFGNPIEENPDPDTNSQKGSFLESLQWYLDSLPKQFKTSLYNPDEMSFQYKLQTSLRISGTIHCINPLSFPKKKPASRKY